VIPRVDQGIGLDLATEPAGVAHARALLAHAEWAAHAYAGYDKPQVDAIVAAVAQAGADQAQRYAEWAVTETGSGVVEHKVAKNLACSTGMAAAYRDHDYVSARLSSTATIVEIPRPAGVVLALTSASSPVASLYQVCVLALMTRSVMVVSPHPDARKVSTDAARALAAAAIAAGAPEGVIQIIDEPSDPQLDMLISDARTAVIVAASGRAVTTAAKGSPNPAFCTGSGNVPALIDATADLHQAAQRIVASKSFDNSLLDTN
jgi:acetaldehyde dehydrogenase / alcohol dehydrogenase